MSLLDAFLYEEGIFFYKFCQRKIDVYILYCNLKNGIIQ